MLNNLKIGLRLGLGFALVVAVLLATVAMGVVKLAELNSDLQLVVNDRFPKTVRANEMVDGINAIAQSMTNAVVVKRPEEIRAELNRVEEARKTIRGHLDELEKVITLDKGKALLAAIKDKRAKYVGGQEEFVKLVNAGKAEEATALLLTQVRPTQREYIAAIEPPPSFGTKIRSDFLQGMGKVKDRFVLILNVQRALSLEELTALRESTVAEAA